MPTTTVHLFYGDTAFVDRSMTFHPAFRPGGIGNLSNRAVSYFRELELIHDVRVASTRDLWWPPETKPVLALDGDEFPDFVTQAQSMSSGDRNTLFGLIDRAIYKYDQEEPLTDVETALRAFSIYKQNSVNFSPGTMIGPVYFDNNGPTQSVRVPDWVQLTITVTLSGTPTDIVLQVWSNNAAFMTGYPISTITAVVPPLPYNRLLSDNLLGTGSNSFQTASQISQLSIDKLQAQIESTDITGYIPHQVRIYDNAGNVVATTFLIAFKGQVPDRIEIRNAIQDEIAASGVGSESSWRSRIPEIYVDSRFYLIPMWDNFTNRPDQVIFPSIINIQQAINNTKAVLPGTSELLLDPNIEIMSTAYEMLTLTAVPHELNGSLVSLRALHPSYLAYAPNQVNFAYMAESTREFANKLISVLAIAKGVATNPLYPPMTEASTGMIYVPFDVGSTEFLVMTKESYLNVIGGG